MPLFSPGIWPGPEHGDPQCVGAGAGIGTNRNFPMPTGEGDAAYCYAMITYGLNDVETFKPDLIIVACGLDAMAGDPYGNFDIIFGTIYRAFLAPTHSMLSVCRGLLVGHADWELSGAWNPMS